MPRILSEMQKRLLTSIIYCLLLITLSVVGGCTQNQQPTLFLIGDSTMADKSNPEKNPERGWGQMLSLFFDEEVTVRNFAVSGRSSKSFIGEGKWDSVKSLITTGDYVFIQFGHNDQKYRDSLRFTNPTTAYRQNLERYVEETRDLGATPVLLTSIVRRNFNEFGVMIDTHGLYPLIVRQVAKEKEVAFIDLQSMTEELVLNMGPERSKDLYLWVEPGEYEIFSEGMEDNTHLSVYGATEFARLAATGLRETDLDIVRYLRTSH